MWKIHFPVPVRYVGKNRYQLFCPDNGVFHVHLEDNTEEVPEIASTGLFLQGSHIWNLCDYRLSVSDLK